MFNAPMSQMYTQTTQANLPLIFRSDKILEKTRALQLIGLHVHKHYEIVTQAL